MKSGSEGSSMHRHKKRNACRSTRKVYHHRCWARAMAERFIYLESHDGIFRLQFCFAFCGISTDSRVVPTTATTLCDLGWQVINHFSWKEVFSIYERKSHSKASPGPSLAVDSLKRHKECPVGGVDCRSKEIHTVLWVGIQFKCMLLSEWHTKNSLRNFPHRQHSCAHPTHIPDGLRHRAPTRAAWTTSKKNIFLSGGKQEAKRKLFGESLSRHGKYSSKGAPDDAVKWSLRGSRLGVGN